MRLSGYAFVVSCLAGVSSSSLAMAPLKTALEKLNTPCALRVSRLAPHRTFDEISRPNLQSPQVLSLSPGVGAFAVMASQDPEKQAPGRIPIYAFSPSSRTTQFLGTSRIPIVQTLSLANAVLIMTPTVAHIWNPQGILTRRFLINSNSTKFTVASFASLGQFVILGRSDGILEIRRTGASQLKRAAIFARGASIRSIAGASLASRALIASKKEWALIDTQTGALLKKARAAEFLKNLDIPISPESSEILQVGLSSNGEYGFVLISGKHKDKPQANYQAIVSLDFELLEEGLTDAKWLSRQLSIFLDYTVFDGFRFFYQEGQPKLAFSASRRDRQNRVLVYDLKSTQMDDFFSVPETSNGLPPSMMAVSSSGRFLAAKPTAVDLEIIDRERRRRLRIELPKDAQEAGIHSLKFMGIGKIPDGMILVDRRGRVHRMALDL